MRDRLLELLKETFEYTRGVCIDFDEAAEINADHLLANGVIVLPCEVGDTVYTIEVGKVKERTLEKIEFSSEGRIYLAFRWRGGGYELVQVGEIGKTIFLTKEEAERALKGGGSDAE